LTRIVSSLDELNAPVSDGDEKVIDVDRMFLFEKAGLVDFIASVEHSVAVTRKKKIRGEVGEAS
jgi:hypothetical protein